MTRDASRDGGGSDNDDLLPLCVDLDDTLIRTDVFAEQIAGRVLRFRQLGATLRAALAGRAALKRLVSEQDDVAVATLPYRTELVEWLRTERLRGRRIVLATATDKLIADRVAAHLGVFDEVIASDGVTNLKGDAKAAALTARFGERGFVYAGDSRADIPVWKHAKGAVLVGASASVSAAVARYTPIEARFAVSTASPWQGLVRAARPKQWIKNLLVFIPLVMARAHTNLNAWGRASVLFVAFCALASSVYLVNDLLDVQSDRAHLKKRNRALASGAVSTRTTLIASIVLVTLGMVLARSVGTTLVAGSYVALTLSYSVILKELLLVDLFVLATLYALRLIGGGVATGHAVSIWLLAFSGFIFLALAFMKRVAELLARKADGGRSNSRRAYGETDLRYLEIFGIASTMTSALVLTLFVENLVSTNAIPNPLFLLAVVPVVLLWQARLWLATSRGFMHEDPIVYAVGDWVTRAAGVLTLVLFLLAGVDFGIR